MKVWRILMFVSLNHVNEVNLRILKNSKFNEIHIVKYSKFYRITMIINNFQNNIFTRPSTHKLLSEGGEERLFATQEWDSWLRQYHKTYHQIKQLVLPKLCDFGFSAESFLIHNKLFIFQVEPRCLNPWRVVIKQINNHDPLQFEKCQKSFT